MGEVLKAAAGAMGIIITIATAMINFAIQQWNSNNQLVAAIFFTIGGILYIVGSYYGLSTAKSAAVRELEAKLAEKREK